MCGSAARSSGRGGRAGDCRTGSSIFPSFRGGEAEPGTHNRRLPENEAPRPQLLMWLAGASGLARLRKDGASHPTGIRTEWQAAFLTVDISVTICNGISFSCSLPPPRSCHGVDPKSLRRLCPFGRRPRPCSSTRDRTLRWSWAQSPINTFIVSTDALGSSEVFGIAVMGSGENAVTLSTVGLAVNAEVFVGGVPIGVVSRLRTPMASRSPSTPPPPRCSGWRP